MAKLKNITRRDFMSGVAVTGVMAGSDASSFAYVDGAINAAVRAVNELWGQA